MNRTILVVALACVSVVAGAQSSNTNSQNSSNKPSAKQEQKNTHPAGRESSAPSVSEVVVQAPAKGQDHTGNMSGNHKDGWNTVAPSKKDEKNGASGSSDGSTSQWPAKVATGDVNGDGHGDKAATNSSNKNQVQAPRDVASGQASGKRQHKDITVTKEVDKATPKL